MASAVSETIPEVVTVHLELSFEEAVALRDILMKVGGNPHTTRRKHTAAVLEALSDLRALERVPWVRDFAPSAVGGLEFH